MSEDEGRSWKTAETLPGPYVGLTRFVTFEGLSQEARKILVRYELSGKGVVALFVFRVDIDYVDPLAGALPVKVTYDWTEEGKPKAHSMTVDRYPATYRIDVSGTPVMRSVRIEGL